MRREAGFTLLEVLVVIVMIGVLATTVTLSLAPDNHRRLQDEAWRFARVLEAASEQAGEGDPLALEWAPDGYRFLRQGDDGRWQPLERDELLAARHWPDGIVAGLGEGGQSMNAAAPMLLVADGHVTPRVLLLGSGQRKLAVTLSPLGRADVVESH
jgi:general secretion pathway protein H